MNLAHVPFTSACLFYHGNSLFVIDHSTTETLGCICITYVQCVVTLARHLFVQWFLAFEYLMEMFIILETFTKDLCCELFQLIMNS